MDKRLEKYIYIYIFGEKNGKKWKKQLDFFFIYFFENIEFLNL